jgi:hypothetical protein
MAIVQAGINGNVCDLDFGLCKRFDGEAAVAAVQLEYLLLK